MSARTSSVAAHRVERRLLATPNEAAACCSSSSSVAAAQLSESYTDCTCVLEDGRILTAAVRSEPRSTCSRRRSCADGELTSATMCRCQPASRAGVITR
eukprot:1023878-Prymnesium_polylepis.1